MNDDLNCNTDEKGINEPDWNALKKCWPSTIIARSKVSEFTGGLISPGYMANLDSIGSGPPAYSGITKKVFYEVDSLVDWMRERYLKSHCQKTGIIKRDGCNG